MAKKHCEKNLPVYFSAGCCVTHIAGLFRVLLFDAAIPTFADLRMFWINFTAEWETWQNHGLVLKKATN